MKRKVIAAIALLVVIDNAQAGDPFMDQLTQRVLTGPAAALVGLWMTSRFVQLRLDIMTRVVGWLGPTIDALKVSK